MPRKSRIDVAGGVQHVMPRGIERGKVFRSDADRSHFLERLGVRPQEVWAEGKYRRIVQACSLLCYWAVRELGVPMSSLALKLKVSIPSVSDSVTRGRRIAEEKQLDLLGT